MKVFGFKPQSNPKQRPEGCLHGAGEPAASLMLCVGSSSTEGDHKAAERPFTCC